MGPKFARIEYCDGEDPVADLNCACVQHRRLITSSVDQNRKNSQSRALDGIAARNAVVFEFSRVEVKLTGAAIHDHVELHWSHFHLLIAFAATISAFFFGIAAAIAPTPSISGQPSPPR